MGKKSGRVRCAGRGRRCRRAPTSRPRGRARSPAARGRAEAGQLREDGGVARAGVARPGHGREVAPRADDEDEPHPDEHLRLHPDRARPPQPRGERPDDEDDEQRERRPRPDERDEQDDEDGREHRCGPAPHGQPGQRGADHRGRRVAGPRRRDPAGAARRPDGHRVPGHVAAQDEPGEAPAAQHPDDGVPELVDERHTEPQHGPDRPDPHGDQRRDEHDEQRPAGEGDLPHRLHPLPHLPDVHGHGP